MLCLFCGTNVPDPYYLHARLCINRPREVNYTAPYAVGSDTSQAAALSMQPTAQSLGGKILADIKQQGVLGRTCAEVEAQATLRHQTASARLWELRAKGHIKDSGIRRPTPSGRKAVVWIAA